MVPVMAPWRHTSLADTVAPVHRVFSAFSRPGYAAYWAAQLGSLIGSWMQATAASWLVYRLTDSPLALSVAELARNAPTLVVSLWAGAVIDRSNKTRLVALTQMAAMTLALVLAGMSLAGALTAPMLLGALLLIGTVQGFDLPARDALLVQVVGRDALASAIGLSSAAFNLARVLGPLAAAWLLAEAAASWCFLANALTFLPVLWALHRLPAASAAPAHGGSVRDGVRYLLGHPELRGIVASVSVGASMTLSLLTLLPSYATRTLQGGPEMYGSLLAAYGAGAIAGAVLTSASAPEGLLLRLRTFLGVAALAVTGLALAEGPTAALLGMAVLGSAATTFMTSGNALAQQLTDDRFRGRVLASARFLIAGITPLVAAIQGAIAQWYDTRIATGAVAFALAVTTLVATKAARMTINRPGPAAPRSIPPMS
nr:major facilitator transporter [uncultured bacterium]